MSKRWRSRRRLVGLVGVMALFTTAVAGTEALAVAQPAQISATVAATTAAEAVPTTVEKATTKAAKATKSKKGTKVKSPKGKKARKATKRAYKLKHARVQKKRALKIDQADREKAAATMVAEGALNPLMLMAPAAAAAPGEAPHYFSHPNYANSPLPEIVTTRGAQATVGNALQDRGYATDNATSVLVVVPKALPAGMLTSFQVWNQATAGSSSSPSAGKSFHAFVLRPTGGSSYDVVFDSGALTMPALADPATSELAEFPVANLAVQAGDVVAFYGNGVPFDLGTAGDEVYYPVSSGPVQGTSITVGAAPYPTLSQQRQYSFAATVIEPDRTAIGGGIRKFVDPLPEIPVAVPDTTSYPQNGSTPAADYYEIALVEYEQKLHSDLPATKLRGYVQLDTPEIPGDGVPLCRSGWPTSPPRRRSTSSA